MVVCAIYKKLKGGIATGHVDDAYVNVKEYDSTATSKAYIKDGSTIMYAIDDFTCDNTDCNEVFDDHTMSKDDLKSYGTETLMRIYDTVITVGNIYDSQINAVTKTELKELSVKICLVLSDLNSNAVVVVPDDDEDVVSNPKVEKVIGCMDNSATNYDKKHNTECASCCTYDVRLAPISHNISFYKLGEFPSGNKVTMNMDNDTYGVCVREPAYNTIGDDGYFYGYQEDSEISLNDIEMDRLTFKDDVGFYDNPSKTLISDVKIAMTWYMHRVSKNNQNAGDECILVPLHMNGIIVEIKDSSGINHGVIKFGGENPTLRIDAPSFTKWLDYRASNTPNGRENASNDVKFVNVDKVGSFYNMTCAHYMKDNNYTSKSDYECIDDEGGWITISKGVSESTTGLGTLLGRKEKPIIGLGSLLED